MASLPIEIASTIQTASIKRSPSPTHDSNPSVVASLKEPVHIVPEGAEETSSSALGHQQAGAGAGAGTSVSGVVPPPPPGAGFPDTPTLSSPRLRAARRHPPRGVPALPDLRFEQSYLASIAGARGDPWAVAWITARDQVLLPLVQGTLWTLAVAGWRHWNSGARFAGHGVGARIRRWWWGVNGWDLPSDRPAAGMGLKEGRVR